MGADDLGKRIKSARRERGTGVRELARQAGIAPAFVTDIEAGRRMPSAEVLARIAGALGISLAELQDLDPRVTPGVRQWMDAEPRVSTLLQRLEGHPGRDALLARMEKLMTAEGPEEER
jgi:transcriptional regulator with XRE-family HTH domain